MKCTFCNEEAVEGGYIQPPMCEKHHAVAIIISMLKGRGQIASKENIRLMAAYYPKAGLDPNEVEDLLKPMRGDVRNEEQE
jgi:hypothetical protein